MNGWFPLMQPIATDELITAPGWIHQIKYDGIRLLSIVQEDSVQLYTRNQQLRTAQYPELLQLHRQLNAKTCVLDGELIVRTPDGRPSFASVLYRDRSQTPQAILQMKIKFPIEYHVFDVLMQDGMDLRSLSLAERLDNLARLMKPNDWLHVVDSEIEAAPLFQQMQTQGWEGIVSKKLAAPYIGGKQHQAWYKKKIVREQLCVVGGVQYRNGYPNSLLIGVYVGDQLQYIGKVASGLKSRDLVLLHTYVPQLQQSTSPFQNQPPTQQPLPVRWLQPRLTVQVAYTELTDEQVLRQPKIVGFTTLPAAQARWDG